MNNIKFFTDLIVWQKGHALVLEVYKVTKLFPKEELFVLIPQLRRCSISITSNIAEGFSRNTRKEKVQFYATSLGSLTELQNQLLIARDLVYITINVYNKLFEDSVEVHKMLNAMIKSANGRFA